jgi:hypothetical protein
LERQYLAVIIAVAVAFSALVGFSFYNPFQQSEGDTTDVIKAKKGELVYVRYSPAVVKMIQDLPNGGSAEVEVSSELQVTNLAGLSGEIRYSKMEITYVQNGEVETIDEDDFSTVEYRFRPDTGNTTSYVYDNIDFIARSTESQVIVAVRPLPSADVGDRYTVKLLLNTGGVVNYAITDKIIEIVA